MKKIDKIIVKSEIFTSERSFEEITSKRNKVIARIEEINGPIEVINTVDVGIAIPPPQIVHWDNLLKEMIWLAGDFQKERLRHVNNGKKISKALEVYNKTKELKDQKKSKEDALALRKIASKISRDIRKFWLKIDKVVAFKQKTDADEVRQKAMDKHLVHLIKQTERYTNLLAENLKTGGTVGMSVIKPTAISRKRSHSPVGVEELNTSDTANGSVEVPRDINVDQSSSDEDFMINDDEISEDDETTLIEEERKERDITVEEEISLLKRESEMSVDELRALYADVGNMESSDEYSEEENGATEEMEVISGSNEDDDEDYVSEFEADEVDDETTLIEEENRGRDIAIDEELKLLHDEGTIPIELLRAKYASLAEMSNSDNESSEGSSESSSEINRFKGEIDDDDEDEDYEIESSEDDETTLIEEEKNTRDMTVAEEIDLLQKESTMSIEQLRAMYAGLDSMSESSLVHEHSTEEHVEELTKNESECESDEDYEFEENFDQVDDETTLIEEELLERDMPVLDELKLLQDEGNMPIEQLREMYASMEEYDGSNESEEDEEEDSTDQDKQDLQDSAIEPAAITDDDSEYSMLPNVETRDDSAGDTNFDDALKRLESADLAARSVRVERPYILSNSLTLREYQHVGLNWLVSLHERRLNGILADEMGLGKTIQTISMLAYLAAYRGLWGPHLIVVPTSCIVNWESEFKKWCPIFKVLTYYGGAKIRKQLRSGWSKPNSFHVCITSYQLVVQDSSSFRRKRWYYMILDEAHNIKNFKSQRWQTLLNFNTQRRLLLTGTPLQNNLMELWSLMHFLMPHIFRSRKEFSYWFSNPLNNMVEGNRNVNNDVISKLHGIMRPFLLRRLKKDVEKQLPAKFEHIVMCKLSKRQQYLYEEYMSRTTTKASLTGGGYLGMMSILMQLRKVCNHPDLFEPRPIISPFVTEELHFYFSRLIPQALDKHPIECLSGNYIQFWPYYEDSLMSNELLSLRVKNPRFITIDNMSFQSESITGRPHYNNYINKCKQSLFESKKHSQLFNFSLSTHRCFRPRIDFSWRTDRALKMPDNHTVRAVKARFDNRIRRQLPLCWFDFVKTVDERALQCQEMIEKFVFILPKISVKTSLSMRTSRNLYVFEVLSGCGKQILSNYSNDDIESAKSAIKIAMAPMYNAAIRQQIFFPDRKLIQFDSGKLQTLSVMLHDLKRGGHKCLIFTQMSKMLDILEIFLNIHGHTYVRLDGSTSVDRRQKLMDRYNSDPKLFCFILSTRSGGLGINLTGADTVIFFDSDWNPAMDAQAQDRAHRIGQTREVHIYRLVSASTVEENILVKAKQKRHLDFLVMTEGNFSEESLFTSRNLQDMLGVVSTNSNTNPVDTRNNIAAAMAAVEDADDVSALRIAEKEVENEQAEFDENGPIRKDDGDEEDNDAIQNGGNSAISSDAINEKDKEDKDLELEFESWQAKIGPDIGALQKALRPVERFAFALHTDVEPFYSIYYIQEQQRLANMAAEEQELAEQWDIDAIEREREEEEYRALSEGELLATNLSKEDALALKNWFLKERSLRKRERRKRIMTGAGWNLCIDPITRVPYWFNDDTGEASYAMPQVIQEREANETALARGFSAAPNKVMIHIMSYLPSYPDRMTASRVCSRWRDAAIDPLFHIRVLPVESGARDTNLFLRGNDSFNTYSTVDEAIAKASPGDTIMLGSGHHWETSLIVDKPLRIIGDCDDPARCILELTGEIYVSKNARCALISTITIRRPRKVSKRLSCLTLNHSSVEMFNCIISNDGSNSSAIVAINSSRLSICSSSIRGGTIAGISAFSSSLLMSRTKVIHNSGCGIALTDCDACLEECLVSHNNREGILVNRSSAMLADCHCARNELGSIVVDDTSNSSSIVCRYCHGDEEFVSMISASGWSRDDLFMSPESRNDYNLELALPFSQDRANGLNKRTETGSVLITGINSSLSENVPMTTFSSSLPQKRPVEFLGIESNV